MKSFPNLTFLRFAFTLQGTRKHQNSKNSLAGDMLVPRRVINKALKGERSILIHRKQQHVFCSGPGTPKLNENIHPFSTVSCLKTAGHLNTKNFKRWNMHHYWLSKPVKKNTSSLLGCPFSQDSIMANESVGGASWAGRQPNKFIYT